MSTTDTRAAFEAWAKTHPEGIYYTNHYGCFGNVMQVTYDIKAQAAWQAATEAAKATGTAGEPVAYLRFRAAQQWSGIGGHDIEYNEWLETCHAHEVGDDGKPAFPVFDSPALLHADSDIFDLIREWAALPEGKRHDAARAIIGSVNRSYSAGVADGKVLGEAARQPAPVVDKKLSDTVKPVLTPEDFGILDPELSKRAVNFHNAMVHQAALAATAAPVLGLKMVCDPNMPSDQVEFRMNGETVGRIVNIATRSQP